MRLLLIVLLLFPLVARADEGLHVSVLFGSGQQMVQYQLSTQETRQFWLRWRELKVTTNMVPLAIENGYRGLRLRVDDDTEIRLYNGVGAMGTEARTDDFRVLERWVLTKAPPATGQPIIDALDAEVDQADARAAPLGKIPSSVRLIADCRKRAGNSQRLRAQCLMEAFLQYRDPDVAIKTLQQALVQTDPTPPPSQQELLKLKNGQPQAPR